MAIIKKKPIAPAEVPTSSMADIAFLLLVFFIVATVIDVDTGIGITLPPMETEDTKVDPDRLANLWVNNQGQVLLDNEETTIVGITENLKDRIRERITMPKSKKLIVSIKADRKIPYKMYIDMLDAVKMSFYEVRDEFSNQRFGEKFEDLNEEQKAEVKEGVPIIISIAEPEEV